MGALVFVINWFT